LTRPTPKEDAVRNAFKEERAEMGDESSGNDDGTEAVAPPEVVEPKVEEDELTVARRERDEYLDLAKRTQADFENYRKRAAKDMAAAGSRARIGLIREILPVVDNLERALGVAPEGEGDAFVEGVRLVYRELEGALARAGVEAIEPKGDAFDPNVHEALSMRPQDGAESGTVVEVVEKGYRAGGTVVRPARVVVAA
jgi:molecular chaperone GrpE